MYNAFQNSLQLSVVWKIETVNPNNEFNNIFSDSLPRVGKIVIGQYFSTSSIFAIETNERTYKKKPLWIIDRQCNGVARSFRSHSQTSSKKAILHHTQVNVDKTPLIDDIGLSESLYLKKNPSPLL